MTRAGRVLRASSIRDLRLLARRRAPRAVFDYTDGGAGDELSLRRSRASYSRVEFVPRVLHDVSSVDVATTILGAPSAAPLVFAPTGFTRMMHTEGESAVARVAARVGIPYALSTMGTTSVEQLAADDDDQGQPGRPGGALVPHGVRWPASARVTRRNDVGRPVRTARGGSTPSARRRS